MRTPKMVRRLSPSLLSCQGKSSWVGPRPGGVKAASIQNSSSSIRSSAICGSLRWVLDRRFTQRGIQENVVNKGQIFRVARRVTGNPAVNFIHPCLEILPSSSASMKRSNGLSSFSPSARLSCAFGPAAFCATAVPSIIPDTSLFILCCDLQVMGLLLAQKVRFREQECDFGQQKFCKFPVFFPCSQGI